MWLESTDDGNGQCGHRRVEALYIVVHGRVYSSASVSPKKLRGWKHAFAGSRQTELLV